MLEAVAEAPEAEEASEAEAEAAVEAEEIRKEEAPKTKTDLNNDLKFNNKLFKNTTPVNDGDSAYKFHLL